MKLILALLLVCPIIAEKLDRFFFHTTLRCGLNNKPLYHYSIRFFENDKITFPDRLSDWHEGGTMQPNGVPTEVDYKETEDGDEVENYTFYTKIKHDCTDNGEWIDTTIYNENNLCRERQGDCHIVVNQTLTNMKGTKREFAEIWQH